MRVELLCILGLTFVMAHALPASTVSHDVANLIIKINRVNNDLIKKQKQQKQIEAAIDDSDDALTESQRLLAKLRQQRELDLNQLQDVENLLAQVESATLAVQDNVRQAIGKIYQQVKTAETANGSIFAGNNTLQNERRKVYLIKLLQLEEQKYQDLQSKLDQLNTVNDKIIHELDRLDKQLGMTSERGRRLELSRESQMAKAKQLQAQIKSGQQLLSDLKEKQRILNQFIADMAVSKDRMVKAKPKQVMVNQGVDVTDDEKDSPFFLRKLAKPIQAPILVDFADMRGGAKNNGTLFKADANLPVYSISVGDVVYVGKLAGFGQIVVVDYGDNYIAIYSGIIPKVSQGQHVRSGMIIANSGTIKNQPMNGVYFELRHLGKPVNPSKLVN